MFPMWGLTGLEGGMHVSEIEGDGQEYYNSNLVEIVLDYLETGSVLGLYTTAAKESFSI